MLAWGTDREFFVLFCKIAGISLRLLHPSHGGSNPVSLLAGDRSTRESDVHCHFPEMSDDFVCPSLELSPEYVQAPRGSKRTVECSRHA